MRAVIWAALLLGGASAPVEAPAETVLGDEPALGSPESRITQAEIAAGHLSLTDLRRFGLKMFATPFTKADGFGDGLLDPADKTSPGGRPTLQGNGTFLRVNGLDSQACLDCHSVISADAVPIVLGVGGAGGINDSAMFMPRAIDVADRLEQGRAGFDGRLINPPALFGVGGVQLVAREMTARLQQLRRRALDRPGRSVRLRAKGVDFGTIVADSDGVIDTSGIVGVDDDLIVRPFGRKGEFASVREFDVTALRFHMGMSPVEFAGESVDDDEDGIVNEVLIGEVSVLEIFLTTQETPVRLPAGPAERAGWQRFLSIGCDACHKPEMRTADSVLTYSQPEVLGDPARNVFYAVDLAEPPMSFRRHRRGGIIVPMFSDLKRHDMGQTLAEDFHGASPAGNREFITAKLWGVADTAPYLHDGRALTLNEAIMLHAGEAAGARDAYARLRVAQKNELLVFLKSLRNPRAPNGDVLR